jgi:deoxyribodipyrimidine photolyase-related protein
MSVFKKELLRYAVPHENRTWLYVPYDQLSDKIGPLSREKPRDVGIILIENPWKPSLRPYHRQKLALILANMRHFALEQARRGVAVKYLVAQGPYRNTLETMARELGQIRLMEPLERELRVDLEPLAKSGLVSFVPHEGRLTTRDLFETACTSHSRWRMDLFYRVVRKKTGILMDRGKPVGEKLSHDSANRKPWKGSPPAPQPCAFPNNPIKEEVGQLIETVFQRHPGKLDLSKLPCTLEDAETLWRWAKDHCMEHFGPYEDAMSTRSSGLFHTRISSVLNIHRLLPSRVVRDVLEIPLPIESKEGFVRQVLGWREFVCHVHESTDGFRRPTDLPPRVGVLPGDAGYGRITGDTWYTPVIETHYLGGASPSFLGAENPLPPAYWGSESGLACLDNVVADVWADAYSHHITRLMVLSNIATLLDVNPREIADWFWIAYADAYDWVVEPNVLGMGTYAVGPLMTTKPYVAGANYINKMSDYCETCDFDPRTNCPITPLYWAFLDRHYESLRENPRIVIPLKASCKRDETLKRRDRAVFELVNACLQEGTSVTPKMMARLDPSVGP